MKKKCREQFRSGDYERVWEFKARPLHMAGQPVKFSAASLLACVTANSGVCGIGVCSGESKGERERVLCMD